MERSDEVAVGGIEKKIKTIRFLDHCLTRDGSGDGILRRGHSLVSYGNYEDYPHEIFPKIPKRLLTH